MTTQFTHLHLHTQFSMLDGAIKIDDLISKTQEYEMNAVAITDHGAMYGAFQFYDKAKAAGINPLVGCEFYISATSRLDHSRKAGPNFHLVALAMNNTGYKNLLKLASIAQTEGFYYRPRIDMEVLNRYNEGIIVLTACIQGEVPRKIINNDMDGARAKALELKKIFGDRLYFEIQENGIKEQRIANEGIINFAEEMNVKVVATNDCHYLNPEDAYAHEILLSIQSGHTITDPKRFKFSTDQLYFKSSEEMAQDFSHYPQAISNTMEVAERCDMEIPSGAHYFPIFKVEEPETLETLFNKECQLGLAERLSLLKEQQEVSPELEKQYRDRLEFEIGIIERMGFAGYFLIVSDFIKWAKDQGIPVGPGRGSGAGSLVAYCMRITDIDPIPYGLLFERFLNEQRQSMPDFDVDFCKERREEVINYVRKKYGGDDYVAQIVAYGSMKARAVIRDVGRVLEVPLPVVDKIAKLVPEGPKVTIKEALLEEPRLKRACERDESTKELIRVAQTLEGLCRHKSTHAAGVVISPTPMVDYLPVCVVPRKGEEGKKDILTQYDMKYTEKTGLIKFDFLGLKTLTIIDRAVKLIKLTLNKDIVLEKIPLTDPETYDFLCRGDSLGIFQLESDGMRDLLTKLKPEKFSDIIALVALYRPGPLNSGMVETFVDTKHGRKEAQYPLPQLKGVLEETYGVIVYQEQVMKIASILAGFSLGEADILRRAMGKKDAKAMEEQRDTFINRSVENNVPKEKAEYIFDLIAKFAEYGFNKSHSAAYALVAYQTAWLKTHYPAQFMAALLSCDSGNTEKVNKYISECTKMGIEVLPPDINESFSDFTVIKNKIRFGLAAIKNVGGAALDFIIEERQENGHYKSISDFCNRIDLSKVNKKVIESIIKAGGFDSLGYYRAQYMEGLDTVLERAKAIQRDKLSGQMSLFATVTGESNNQDAGQDQNVLPDIEEWSKLEKLRYEKETLGLFITGHPLESIIGIIRKTTDTDIKKLDNYGEGQAVRIGGLVQSMKEHKSKKGDLMAFITLEDMDAKVEVVIFPRTFAKCSQLLYDEDPVIILGRVQKSERGVKIIAEEVENLDDAMGKYIKKAKLTLHETRTSRQHMEEVKELLYNFHGKTPMGITIRFEDKGEVDIAIMYEMKIRPCPEFFGSITKLCGKDAIATQLREAKITNRYKGNFGKYNKKDEH